MAKNSKNLYVVLGFKDAGYAKGLRQAQKNLETVGKSVAAIGASITASLGLATKAAAEEEANIAKLSTAMANVGISYDKAKGSLESWLTANQNATSFADSEQRDALSSLITMTGDLAQSQDLLSLAMDMSAGTGKELTSVTSTLGYALAGNWGMVNRMIPALSQVETEEEKWAMLRSMFAGQAETYGRTLQGQLTALKNTAGDMAEMIGGVLIPVLTDFIDKVKPVVSNIQSWVSENPKLAETVVKATAAIGIFLTVAGGVLLLLPKIRAAWLAFNAVFSATPIGAIIAAIGLLIAAGITLAENWEWVKKRFADVWDENRIIFASAIKFITNTVLTPFFAYVEAVIVNLLRGIAQVASIFSPALAQKINNIANQVSNAKDSINQWADSVIDSAQASKDLRQEQYNVARAAEQEAASLGVLGVVSEDIADALISDQQAIQGAIQDTIDMMSLLAGGGTGSSYSGSGGSSGAMLSSNRWATMYKNAGSYNDLYVAAWNMTSEEWLKNNLLNITGMTRDEAVIQHDYDSELGFLAAGGIVTSPTVAMIGEGSEPEAVLPLSKLETLLKDFSISGDSTIQATIPVYIGNELVTTVVSKQLGKMANSRSQLGGS